MCVGMRMCMLCVSTYVWLAESVKTKLFRRGEYLFRRAENDARVRTQSSVI